MGRGGNLPRACAARPRPSTLCSKKFSSPSRRRRTPSTTPSSGGDSGDGGGDGDGSGAPPDEGDSADPSWRDVARAPAGDAAGSDEGGAAFARARAEIKALPFEETRRITVHVPLASMLALGALPKMRVFREAMIAELVSPRSGKAGAAPAARKPTNLPPLE
jgi:hypothetical protein